MTVMEDWFSDLLQAGGSGGDRLVNAFQVVGEVQTEDVGQRPTLTVGVDRSGSMVSLQLQHFTHHSPLCLLS